MTVDHSSIKNNEDLLEDFFLKVKRKIIQGKRAYLLIDLLHDFMRMSEEEGFETPIIDKSWTLKMRIIERFPEDISFYPSGRNCLVHSSQMNPCEYSIATIKGRGLRDEDIIRAFSAMVRRKVAQLKQEDGSKYDKQRPYTPDEVLKLLDIGPLPHLYNVIYATLHPNYKLNDNGYAETKSGKLATKIWSMASEWESFITKEKSVKQGCCDNFE